MREKIRNKDVLLSHGDRESRRIVLDITEKTLRRLDAKERIKSIMTLDGDTLRIGIKEWDLSKKKNIYLLGGGKACNHMAMAVDEILGDRLTRGVAIVKIAEDTDVFNKTEVYVGGHPLPNEEGYRASRIMLDIVDRAGPDDLFIVVISGGSSALMSCPIDGISLADEIAVTDVMLKSGANIFEINAIRRHISRMNGGMLAKRIEARGAELIGFGISDAVASPPTGDIGVPYAKYRATPMGPDQTTLDDARRVIRDYDVADKLPKNVVDYLMSAGPERETPKAFPNNTYFLINTLPDSCRYAKEAAEEMGIPAHVLTTYAEGESRDYGTFMASLAREVVKNGRPFRAPCFLLSAGETTTAIPDSSLIRGHGGPSQEMTAAFAVAAEGLKNVCLLSMDSEGTDGTTPMAGGLTDGTTGTAATERGIDLRKALREHAAYEALEPLGDTVLTGNTGTNLCDFNVLYIGTQE